MARQHHQRHCHSVQGAGTQQHRPLRRSPAQAGGQASLCPGQHPQRPGQPGGGVELVDMGDQPADKAAARQKQASQQGRHPPIPPEPQQRIAPQPQQPGVQRSAPVDLVGHRQTPAAGCKERPVQRVEHGGLWVGQQRPPQKQIGVPKGQLAGAQLRAGVGPVRIEIELDVAARQHPVGEEQLAVEPQDEPGQQPGSGAMLPAQGPCPPVHGLPRTGELAGSTLPRANSAQPVGRPVGRAHRRQGCGWISFSPIA